MEKEYDYSEIKREFKLLVPIEGIVASQINRIMEAGSRRKTGDYEIAIDRLIDLLAPEQEEKALEFKKKHNIVYDLSPKGKEAYVVLFRFIKKLFAEDGVIWRRSRYEVGHE